MKKKKFAVYARTKRIVRDGLQTGKGHRQFRVNKSLMNINDPAEAKEIEDRYGMKGSQDVYVVEDERYANAVNGEQWDVKGSQVSTVHHYTFGTSPRYANAWDAFEKRRKDKHPKKRATRSIDSEVVNGKKKQE